MFRAMSLVHASGAGSAGVRNSLLPILSSTVGQARTFANGASDPIASARAADAALADNGGSTNRPFVSATWLEKNLDKAVVIDSSWRLSNPDPKVTPYDEFLQRHIPGSYFVNVDTIADTTDTSSTAKPHRMPSPELFGRILGNLGLSEKDPLVLYDAQNMIGSPRLWWMLQAFGATNVRILEGGMNAWVTAKKPLEAGSGKGATGEPKKGVTINDFPDAKKGKFNAKSAGDNLVKIDTIRSLVTAPQTTFSPSASTPIIVDARSPGRFAGTDPEPRPGIPSGHMPSAFNTPFSAFTFVDAAGVTRFKSRPEIEAIFSSAGVDLAAISPDRRVITSCGSGMTAATVFLGLHIAGHRNKGLFDGSWIDYTAAKDLPIITDKPASK